MIRARVLPAVKWLSPVLVIIAIASFFAASTRQASAIPALARKYGLSCADCHIHGAKLNTFGLEFVAKGPKALQLEENSPLTPLTLYVSYTAKTRGTDNEIIGAPSRFEVVSFDNIDERLAYFLEWRLLSRDNGSGDFVDRSGRFEDVYITYELNPHLGLQVGQFRAMSQYDVSQRIGNSEPLAFSRMMPGDASSTSARLTATRAFAAGSRSPAVRLMTNPKSLSGWHSAVTLPFGGELSIPLTDEAETNASPEFEANPKGIFAEHYWQKDLDTIGINAFAGSASRSSVGLVGTKSYEKLHFVGGLTRQRDRTGERTLLSIDGLFAPRWNDVYGLRLDLEEGQFPIAVPYMSYHIGAPGSVYRFVLEGRFQPRRRPSLTLELNFLY